jgi:hypothetical protein
MTISSLLLSPTHLETTVTLLHPVPIVHHHEMRTTAGHCDVTSTVASAENGTLGLARDVRKVGPTP